MEEKEDKLCSTEEVSDTPTTTVSDTDDINSKSHIDTEEVSDPGDINLKSNIDTEEVSDTPTTIFSDPGDINLKSNIDTEEVSDTPTTIFSDPGNINLKSNIDTEEVSDTPTTTFSDSGDINLKSNTDTEEIIDTPTTIVSETGDINLKSNIDTEEITNIPTTIASELGDINLKSNINTEEVSDTPTIIVSETDDINLKSNIDTDEVCNTPTTIAGETDDINLKSNIDTEEVSDTPTTKDEESKDSALCSCDSHSNTTYHAKVELNISGKIKCIFQPLILPQHLTHLYLSNNKLLEVPEAVLRLEHIVKIDLSNNYIKYFDETPGFVHRVQELSLANNCLLAPPFWVWKETPCYLTSLDLSENSNMVSYLKEHGKSKYFDCWLNICKINLINCRIHTCTEILYTLLEVKELFLGGGDYTALRLNEMYEFPVDYIKECYNIYVLNLQNCKIYDIHKTISYYNRIFYLDLSLNYISYLPEQIGDLINLEIFDLSCNKLDSLPNSIVKMERLKILLLTNNRIQYIPENLFSLPEIERIDFYDNCLSDIPKGYEKLEEVDFAQNYFSEPEQSEYIEQRTKLRLHHPTYYQKRNGMKVRPPESTHSDSDTHCNLMLDEDLEKDVVEVTLLENTPVEDWVVDDDQEVAVCKAEESEIDYDIYQLFE